MGEDRMIDLRDIIGVYVLCNTASVLVHRIDYSTDKVLASLNGIQPEWCDMTEVLSDETGEMESGFYLGSLFVPFAEVMRFYGGMDENS